MKYQNIREEELKNKVGQDFFFHYDTSKIVGNIDFCVSLKDKNQFQVPLFETPSLLWAEAKKGTFDMLTMMTQLVLTIGKARTFDKYLPPAFLGAFDSQKIGFIPYNTIIDVFSMNDFNWNVTPSNHKSKEFELVKDRIENWLHKNHYVYDFVNDEKELQFFIKNNIAKATESGKILIDKNNFVPIYLRWLDQVKPHINFDWAEGKKQNISDNDFYLADLFVDDKGTNAVEDDTPLSDNLFVVFRNSHYEIAKENLKSLFNASIEIKDKTAYEQFWKKYKRPPLEEFQQYILMRKDLLVPQDIRERKGAFFTPKKWVELSQQYIADVLGEDWQEEFYVWDCAAGTGNLLAGLTNKYNIWASTLDQSDVNAMHERIENGATLLKDHVFQFDFLNDDFSKLPKGLLDIINDDEKRKKLVIYINPPYAEHLDIKNTISLKQGSNKSGLKFTKTDEKYKDKYGSKASRELFVQFFIRINEEIPNATLATFSKIKFINSSNFIKFRDNFKSNFLNGFLCQGNTFDNVKGKFPIGFSVWKLDNKKSFGSLFFDVYNDIVEKNNKKLIFIPIGKKGFLSMNDWIKKFNYLTDKLLIGNLNCSSQDFLHQNYTGITFFKQNSAYKQLSLSQLNIIQSCIYFSVTFNIEATWLNDRDQFLYPNDGWQEDVEFQNDCLAFTIFHSQNRISSKDGTNHWIPFTEQEVNAREKFESNFMTQFIKGKIKPEIVNDLFSSTNPVRVQNPNRIEEEKTTTNPNRVEEKTASHIIHNPISLQFSEKATHVFNAGRELWQYYHSQPVFTRNEANYNVNASLYDIREHFQGRNDKGKMNNKSQNETYMILIKTLRESLKILAKKIEPKVYEYGFLKE